LTTPAAGALSLMTGGSISPGSAYMIKIEGSRSEVSLSVGAASSNSQVSVRLMAAATRIGRLPQGARIVGEIISFFFKGTLMRDVEFSLAMLSKSRRQLGGNETDRLIRLAMLNKHTAKWTVVCAPTTVEGDKATASAQASDLNDQSFNPSSECDRSLPDSYCSGDGGLITVLSVPPDTCRLDAELQALLAASAAASEPAPQGGGLGGAMIAAVVVPVAVATLGVLGVACLVYYRRRMTFLCVGRAERDVLAEKDFAGFVFTHLDDNSGETCGGTGFVRKLVTPDPEAHEQAEQPSEQVNLLIRRSSSLSEDLVAQARKSSLRVSSRGGSDAGSSDADWASRPDLGVAVGRQGRRCSLPIFIPADADEATDDCAGSSRPTETPVIRTAWSGVLHSLLMPKLDEREEDNITITPASRGVTPTSAAGLRRRTPKAGGGGLLLLTDRSHVSTINHLPSLTESSTDATGALSLSTHPGKSMCAETLRSLHANEMGGKVASKSRVRGDSSLPPLEKDIVAEV